MEREFYQENGKNWRKFTLEDDQLVITSKSEGIERSFVFPFAEVGLATGSYDKSVVKERRLSNKLTFIIMATLLTTLTISIFFLSAKGNTIIILLGVFIMFVALGGLILISILSQPKNVEVMGVYLGKASIWFYCRNDIDRKNIDLFVSNLTKTQNKYLKDKYFTFNDAMSKSQRKDRLSWLYENKIITKDELAEQLKKMSKTK